MKMTKLIILYNNLQNKLFDAKNAKNVVLYDNSNKTKLA